MKKDQWIFGGLLNGKGSVEEKQTGDSTAVQEAELRKSSIWKEEN